MSDIGLVENNGGGTNLRNFMAHRGAIIVKEIKKIGTIVAKYNTQLDAETLVLRIVRLKNDSIIYGVILKHVDENGRDEATVNLDFDEIDELVEAIDFIKKTSNDLKGIQRDYTEVMYSTKDDAKLGFFQNLGAQTAFISLTNRSSMFLDLEQIAEVQAILRAAKTHLISVGAEIVRE